MFVRFYILLCETLCLFYVGVHVQHCHPRNCPSPRLPLRSNGFLLAILNQFVLWRYLAAANGWLVLRRESFRLYGDFDGGDYLPVSSLKPHHLPVSLLKPHHLPVSSLKPQVCCLIALRVSISTLSSDSSLAV